MISNAVQSYIPNMMKELPHWVLWKIETDANGRKTKIPYSALYNGKASSTNPKTWTTHEQALKKYNANKDLYSGIGFVFTRDIELVFIDIDHCILEDGSFTSIASEILNSTQDWGFCEVSQSGTGLHLFVGGSIPKSFKNSKNGVEMYCDGRFVAMTGNALRPLEPRATPEKLHELYEKYRTPEIDRASTHVRAHTEMNLTLSDNEILRKASENEVSGDTFRRLYSGDLCGYQSHSEADLRLCQILAFWSNRDFDTIDRLFRSSGAYREKWERDYYRERTISRACDSLEEDLSEFIETKRKEIITEYEKALLQRESNNS